jgi:CheY-like chemotaxis protein
LSSLSPLRSDPHGRAKPERDGLQATLRIRQLEAERRPPGHRRHDRQRHEGDEEACPEAGMAAYLCKPIQGDHLRVTLVAMAWVIHLNMSLIAILAIIPILTAPPPHRRAAGT